MKANGMIQMAVEMALVIVCMKMEVYTKATGRMVASMAKVGSYYSMVITKESSITTLDLVVDLITGYLETTILVVGKTIKRVGSVECISNLMTRFTKETLDATRGMVKLNYLNLMALH